MQPPTLAPESYQSSNRMTRTTGLSPTREGLLRDRWDDSQPKFYDDAHRVSGESDRRLDELEIQEDSSRQRRFPRWAQKLFGRYRRAEKNYQDLKNDGPGSLAARQKAKAKGFCSRCKICFITTGVLLAVFLIASGSGVFWAYNTAPKDGVGLPPVFSQSYTNNPTCSYPLLGTLHLKEVPLNHGKEVTRRLRSWCGR